MPAGKASRSRSVVTGLSGAVLALGALAGCGGSEPTAGCRRPARADHQPRSRGGVHPQRPDRLPRADPQAAAARTLACVAGLPLDVRIGQTMLVTTYDLPRVAGWLRDGLIAGVLANGTTDRAVRRRVPRRHDGSALRGPAGLRRGGRSGPAIRSPDRHHPVSPHAGGDAHPPGGPPALPPPRDRPGRPGGSTWSWLPWPTWGSGRGSARAPTRRTRMSSPATPGRPPGVWPTPARSRSLKHFPGHGSTSGDSHDERVVGPRHRPAAGHRPRALRADHRRRPDCGGDGRAHHDPGLLARPRARSPRPTIDGLLRGELKFDGLVVSDALGMAASGEDDQGKALVGFLEAGGDLGIIGPYGSVQGRRAVRAALRSGDLDRAAGRRGRGAGAGREGDRPVPGVPADRRPRRPSTPVEPDPAGGRTRRLE